MNSRLPERRRAHLVDELRARGMLRVQDLADLLGVAPVTVRRDINHLAAEGVIRKVHGGAALGDQPGELPPLTPTPATHAQNQMIGMLVPSLEYYWPGVIQGAKDQATRSGSRIVLRGSSYEGSADRAQVELLLAAGAGGLILAPDTSHPGCSELLGWLAASRIPVVLVEREGRLASTEEPSESVSTNHLEGVTAVVRHLASLGHRRVGFVTSVRSPHAAEIRAGWDAAVAARDLESVLDLEMGDEVPDSDDGAGEVLRSLIQTGATALLVHADREAIGVAQAAQRHGLQIPEDFSLVTYDDEVAELFSPPLTAVRPPRASIGRAAVHLLHERLADPGRPVHHIVINPRLNIRESTGPLRLR